MLARLSACHNGKSKEKPTAYIDGSFATAKKGAGRLGKTKRGKGFKVMAIITKGSRPLAHSVFSASSFDTKLVKQTIRKRFNRARIGKLVGDRAYDSNPLDKELKRKGIALIAPHKRNRKRKKAQGGRKLSDYKERRTVERLFAWLQNFRGCLVRWEQKQENFKAFIYLAAIIIQSIYF